MFVFILLYFAVPKLVTKNDYLIYFIVLAVVMIPSMGMMIWFKFKTDNLKDTPNNEI
jgi:hypothetical protein